MNRAISGERSLLGPAAALTVTLVALALVVMIMAAAVLAYQRGGFGLSPISFVMGGYFSFPVELTTLVPVPHDGNLPVPTL